MSSVQDGPTEGPASCGEVVERLPRELALLALAYALGDRCAGFQQACHAGDLPLARTLARALALDASDAHANDGWALYGACAGGHLHVAQWLVERFGESAKARAACGPALRDACAQGHLAVAQWLVERFGLTADVFRADLDCRPLAFACGGGHLEIARWLTARFGLTAEDGRAENNYALRRACMNGHLEVARWLAAQFRLNSEDARECDALEAACVAEHCDVAQWLIESFGLGEDDVDDALREACDNDALLAVIWLVTRFDLDAGHLLEAGPCGDEVREWLQERHDRRRPPKSGNEDGVEDGAEVEDEVEAEVEDEGDGARSARR